MKIVKKDPGKSPEIIEIENTFSAFQEAVGGYIETVTLFEDLCLICNEEGRLMGLPHNVECCGVDFVGTVLAVGVDGEEFCGLNDRQIHAVMTQMLG